LSRLYVSNYVYIACRLPKARIVHRIGIGMQISILCLSSLEI